MKKFNIIKLIDELIIKTNKDRIHWDTASEKENCYRYTQTSGFINTYRTKHKNTELIYKVHHLVDRNATVVYELIIDNMYILTESVYDNKTATNSVLRKLHINTFMK